MRLRTQLILGLCVAGALMFAAIFGGVGPYLSRSLSTIERTDAERNVERVRSTFVRELSTLEAVSRDWGAWDEFVALLPEINSPKDAEFAADKILAELRSAFGSAEQARGLSVSIGIALFPDDGEEEPDHLLQKADKAMYTAKSQGRDAWWRYDRHTNGNTPS